jgi:hypothetical protein
MDATHLDDSLMPKNFHLLCLQKMPHYFCQPMPSGEELEAYYGKHFNYSWYQQRLYLKKAQACHWWRRMKFRFKKHGIQPGNFLDFGGGYGVFTRWMRDEGYDFFHYDQQPQLMAHLRRRNARQSRA